MSDSVPASQVDAAKSYEALFVPALFAPWASRVAESAQLRPGQRVLDVACGTGVLAREALVRTAPGGAVAGLDPNAGMLAVARALAPAIDWRQGVAESLPFPAGGFDAVVSQFGLMFFDDRARALREMLRVLRPGGRLAVAVWDALEHVPAYAALVDVLERVAGPAAADALRAPFALGRREALVTLFRAVGVGRAEIVTHVGRADFPSVRAMVEADLRGWLPVRGVVLPEAQIEQIVQEAEHTLRAHVAPNGRAVFETRAQLVTATRA